jgi:hypothetical protein
MAYVARRQLNMSRAGERHEKYIVYGKSTEKFGRLFASKVLSPF